MKKLPALIKDMDALKGKILDALKREYPVGAIVQWRHGTHWQEGEVIDHFAHWTGSGAALQARNTKTGKVKVLTASDIVWEEGRA